MRRRLILATIATLVLLASSAEAGPAYSHRDRKEGGRLDLRRVTIGWAAGTFVWGADLNGPLKPRYVSGKRRFIQWELDTRGNTQFDYIVKFNRRIIPGGSDGPSVHCLPCRGPTKVGKPARRGLKTMTTEDMVTLTARASA
jgi:hypothetical protein